MTNEIKNGECVEFITSGGTFIGMFDSTDDEHLMVNDVMKINLTPMPSEDGKGFMMIPKLDLINYYSVSKDAFVFKNADIIYIAPITGQRFIDGYKQQYEAYNDMKIQQGSNIEMASTMPPAVSPQKLHAV